MCVCVCVGGGGGGGGGEGSSLNHVSGLIVATHKLQTNVQLYTQLASCTVRLAGS